MKLVLTLCLFLFLLVFFLCFRLWTPTRKPQNLPPTQKGKKKKKKKKVKLGIKIMFRAFGPLPSKNISAQAPAQQGKISRLPNWYTDTNSSRLSLVFTSESSQWQRHVIEILSWETGSLILVLHYVSIVCFRLLISIGFWRLEVLGVFSLLDFYMGVLEVSFGVCSYWFHLSFVWFWTWGFDSELALVSSIMGFCWISCAHNVFEYIALRNIVSWTVFLVAENMRYWWWCVWLMRKGEGKETKLRFSIKMLGHLLICSFSSAF